VTRGAVAFTFDAQRKRSFITSLFGDPVYQICLKTLRDTSEIAWVKHSIGIFPDSLTVRCSLKAATLECEEVRALR
jgi:hypothetical protein